jgi:hypothetical protein
MVPKAAQGKPTTMSSMNTQTRYRTLVSHLAKVYAAEESARTLALHDGLDEIVAKLQPDGSTAWKQVKADSQRLLKVWMARETRPGDAELASQILDALDEFATDAAIVSAVAAVVVTPPVSEEKEKVILVKMEPPSPIPAKTPSAKVSPAPPAPAPAPAPVTAKAPAPAPAPAPVTVKAPSPAPAPAPVKVAPVLVVQDKIQVVEDEETDEEIVEEEVEEEEVVEETEEVVEEEVEEETEETEEVEEVEEEEEVVEAEEEEIAEDEEEGMEVEKKIFRGRAYWVDIKTNKLYTVVGDEDVGDEVGKMVDGRPVFLSR